MIDKYCYFDVDGFLADYEANERLLRELNEKRASIADSGGIDYEQVRGSGIGDPTMRKVNQILRLDGRIERLVEYFNLYDRIVNSLTAEEKRILVYLQTPPRNRNIQRLADSLGYSRSSAYRLIVDTRQKIRQIANYEL